MDVPPIVALEDEPDDVEFIRRALNRSGLSNPLLTVATVDEAQQVCATHGDPVLMLVDVYLHGESGLDFLAWLRSQPGPLGQTPAVVFSVSTDVAHQHRARALGGSLFLGKPVNEEVLSDAIMAFGLVETTTVKGGAHRKWLVRRDTH